MEKEVRIGDRTVGLSSLSGFKVMRAGTLLARITRQVTGVEQQIQEFVSSYRAANTELITRAKFEYRQGLEEAARIAQRRAELAEEHPDWSDEQVDEEIERLRGQIERARLTISDEAWEKSDNQVELATDPSPFQIGAYLLPQVLDAAEDDVVRLLALVTAPESELREAKRDGGDAYVAYLSEKGEALLFDAEIEQLIELAITAAEVLGEKLRGKAPRLRAAWNRLTGAEEAPAESQPETETETTPDGTSSNSTSSTDSPPPTDGEPTSPSSPSGTPSSVSASA
jgi:transposase